MVLAIATAPWALEVLWAPIINRATFRPMGRYRAWILGALLGLLLTPVALASLSAPHLHLTALAWLFFAQGLCSSASDVASDGLAIDVLPLESGRLRS